MSKESSFEYVRRTIREFGEEIKELYRVNNELRKELVRILDFLIARGKALHYEDAVYRRRYQELVGHSWEDEER